MHRLRTEALALWYGHEPVVEDLALEIPDGQVTALVGANGSGKSTILKSLARILQPRGGAVYLNGKAIHEQPTRVVAKEIAILPQQPDAPSGLIVQDLVAYGRFPHQRGFGSLKREDKRLIRWALDATGMTSMAGRSVGTLSGGQRQRAWIAMALAQDTPYLLLDDPTTFLDIAYQLEVLSLLRRLNHDAGRTIVMVVHDLNHAARFADHIVAIASGKVVVEGTPRDVMIPWMLRTAFGVEADIIPDPRTGAPMCIPFGLVSDHEEDNDSEMDVAVDGYALNQLIEAGAGAD